MLIVLEGIDASGKTTLAESLAERANLEVRHFGPPDEHPVVQWGREFDHPEPMRVIYDRIHWGEPVYGPPYRGRSELGDVGFRWFEMILAARGAVTVVTRPDVQKTFERVVALDDDYVRHDKAHLQSLQDAYEDLVPLALTPVYRHNIDAWPIDEELLITLAARRAMNVPRSLTRLNYIGVQRPEVLLVGDRPGNGELGMLPFSPMPNSCGEFLFEALRKTVWGAQARWGIVNAFGRDGKGERRLEPLWSDLGRPAVVALGNYAHEVLCNETIPHGRTYHPQYAKRFHHSLQSKYGRSIAAAATDPTRDARRFFK